MKDVPEIAPEIRGLIEEIVANPRSHLRLAPRRALLPWLERGDTVSTRECSSETAARHLVAEHREAVARLLREASNIAFWKRPVLSPRPVGTDGRRFDPAAGEDAWRTEARGRARMTEHDDDGVELLRTCLDGIDPGKGLALARASLALVRTDEGHLALAEHMKTIQPRSALRLFERLARAADASSLRTLGWAGMGGCLCYTARFGDSVDAYRMAGHAWPSAWLCILNLACIGGRTESALEAASEIEHALTSGPQLEEGIDVLASWSLGLSQAERSRAASTLASIRERLPQAAWRLRQAYA